jgi:peptidoglycan/LPS O-acetylase OafA/YrhL
MGRRPAPGSGPEQATGIRYQPALDGLRGVAVLAVLAYHANLPFAPGGFLGVDLFFVLSGYLITTLLLKEWAATGGIDLRRFWGRRARRLLPALLLMLVAVAAYAAFVADPAQHDRLRADALATLAYVANWQQVVAGLSYFEQFQDPSPLKHTWSLGIEEQYYLLWPLLVLGALALLGRVRGRAVPSAEADLARATPGGGSAGARARPRLGWLLAAVVLGAAGSVWLMAVLYEPGTDPSRVYYGTDTRAQALLIGAALAIGAAWRSGRSGRPKSGARPRAWLRSRPKSAEAGSGEAGPGEAGPGGGGTARSRPAARWVEGAGLAGLAVLAAMIVAVRDRDEWLYQGGLALAAVAAAAVIAAAVRDRGRVRSALAFPPLRLVGIVSYGLYLWHWPVYVLLTPDRTGWSGPGLLAARLAVTFAAALASYVLVERPIRRGPIRQGRGLAVATGTITATACLLVLATTGAKTPLPGTALAAGSGDDELLGAGSPLGDPGAVVAPRAPAGAGDNSARQPGPAPSTGDGEPARQSGRPPVRGDREVRAFIGGDSVALSLVVNVSPEMQADAGVRFVDASELGCGVARARNLVDGQPMPQAAACRRWPENWRDALRDFRVDVAVVFVGAWEVFDKYDDGGRVLQVGTAAYEAYLQQELDFAVRTLTGQGVGRILITNVPCFRVRDTGLNGEAGARNDPFRGVWVNEVLGRFADRHADVVSLLDLRGFLCRGQDGEEYVDRLDGVRVRGDGVHFTQAGAELVWDWLAPRIEAAARAPVLDGRGDARTAAGSPG